ncbi:MAG TPA: ABC transporter permease [Chloroflexia bacterium]|nr:ABC transporter permease [Chloroflexia bacterium]
MQIFVDFYKYFEAGFNYIFTRWERVSPFFTEHLRVSIISLVIAFIIAFPIGLLLSRVKWLSTPVLGFLNILYTIPSLAFLALLVPVFGLQSLTTIVVLIAYSQTMLVRNIALGFNGIDPSVLESARGMGMNSWQVLRRVELPLAAPVIVAGLRVSTLVIISIATIGAWAGAGTLGKLLQQDNPRLNAAGIICVVLMALVADQLYRLIERAATGYRRKKTPNDRQIASDAATLVEVKTA